MQAGGSANLDTRRHGRRMARTAAPVTDLSEATFLVAERMTHVPP
jgi:hypothetical protein